MLSYKGLKNFSIKTKDGETTHLSDLYFDEKSQVIRYLVVNKGLWKLGKKVLLSPILIEKVDLGNLEIILKIESKRLQDCPDVDEDKPISRAMEEKYNDTLFLPYYWLGPDVWGTSATPYTVDTALRGSDLYQRVGEISEVDQGHLRSTKEVTSYHVEAEDGKLGHVTDLIINEKNWGLTYIVVTTGAWLSGKSVLVPIKEIESVDWHSKTVFLETNKIHVENLPTYESSAAVNKVYQATLYDFHGRPKFGTSRQVGDSRPATMDTKEKLSKVK